MPTACSWGTSSRLVPQVHKWYMGKFCSHSIMLDGLRDIMGFSRDEACICTWIWSRFFWFFPGSSCGEINISPWFRSMLFLVSCGKKLFSWHVLAFWASHVPRALWISGSSGDNRELVFEYVLVFLFQKSDFQLHLCLGSRSIVWALAGFIFDMHVYLCLYYAVVRRYVGP